MHTLHERPYAITGWKMVYNEWIKTWGSFIELINYRLSGNLPVTTFGKSGPFKTIKDFLLFDIDRKHWRYSDNSSRSQN